MQLPQDAIIRITTANICGADLHPCTGRADMEPGMVVGHEDVGIVEAVDAGVDRVEVGDRVSVPFDLACGRRPDRVHHGRHRRRRRRPRGGGRRRPGARPARHRAPRARHGQARRGRPADRRDRVVGVYVPEDPGAATEGAQAGRIAFDDGAAFTTGLTIARGQTPVRKYDRRLGDLIIRGRATPSFIVFHELPLVQAPDACARFDARDDGWTKVCSSTPACRTRPGLDGRATGAR